MNKIPIILIYSRILIGILIILIGIGKVDNFKFWISILMITGLLTDIFDGIIARKLKVSTQKLRILDSNVDQFFWLTVMGTIFFLNINFILDNIIWISIISILEISAYVISYKKFSRSIATHSILAKFWTISLVAFLVDLTINSRSHTLFIICVILGIISRAEIILIILNLKKWTTDVPSILSVSKINRGIKIKKSKLFNS
ncbi:CDP-alcohol phosphatidyltransferase family protein [Christiangramia marina]|uniref:CDP-alcohol phosphatidyltransferase family protein n=1 Tax=Christiangramia marina TaxID=409436 RepID=UPI003AA8877C